MDHKFFNFSQPRAKHVGTTQVALEEAAVSGGGVIHDHSPYKTPFSVWIAQMRNRMSLELRYKRLGEGRYEITVAGKREKKAVAA